MIFVALVAAAWGLERAASLSYDGPPALVWLGWALGVAAVGLIAWSAVAMQRAATNILPHRAADSLVTTGPFALSRNPIYLGTTTLLLAAGLVRQEPWLIGAAALDAVLVTKLAIQREEAHLAAKFGAAWEAYKARTGRWIGPV